jgi:hypothetical protein
MVKQRSAGGYQRRAGFVLAAATVLVMAGLGTSDAHASSVSGPTRVSGPSPYTRCPDTLGIGPTTNYPNADVEPFVAVNPRNPHNVIGVYQSDRFDEGGGAKADVAAVSFDGGATWTHSAPRFSTCSGGIYARVSDPWITIGPDGVAYFIGGGGMRQFAATAVLASTSVDGGLHWSNPATVHRDDSTDIFNDKPSGTADPFRSGTAYVVWTRYTSDGHPFFSMTTDAGHTWSPGRDLTPNTTNLFTSGNIVSVVPQWGAPPVLVDVFQYSKGSFTPDDSFMGLVRSTDGGLTWSKPIKIAHASALPDVDPDTGHPLRTGAEFGGLPDVAVDLFRHTLYVAWATSRFSNGAHNDIALAKSTDGGLSWSTPVKVNQSPPGVTAFSPSVEVLPDGTIGVGYYDLRANTPDPITLPTDYFLATSKSGWAPWTETRITPRSFDDSTAPDAGGYFLGDYVGMTNDAHAFDLLFIEAASRRPNNRTDTFYATVAP